jgi:hypothetical protein
LGALFALGALNAQLEQALSTGALEPVLDIKGCGASVGHHTDADGMHIHLREIDETGWITLSVPLPPELIAGAVQVLAVCRGHSTQSHCLEARVRVTDAAGLPWDYGSQEHELSPARRSYVLGCALPDPAQAPERPWRAAALQIRIAARASDITLSDLRIYGVRWDGAQLHGLQAPPPLHQHLSAPTPLRQHRQLNAQTPHRRGSLPSPATLVPGCYLNYDTRTGQTVRIDDGTSGVMFDFSKAKDSAWRTLEMRFLEQNTRHLNGWRKIFEDRKATQTGAAPWTILLHLDVSAPDTVQKLSLPINLRPYDPDIRPLPDQSDVTRIPLSAQRSRHWITLDIGQYMPQNAPPNPFGLVLYVPDTCPRLHVHALSVACLLLDKPAQ